MARYCWGLSCAPPPQLSSTWHFEELLVDAHLGRVGRTAFFSWSTGVDLRRMEHLPWAQSGAMLLARVGAGEAPQSASVGSAVGPGASVGPTPAGGLRQTFEPNRRRIAALLRPPAHPLMPRHSRHSSNSAVLRCGAVAQGMGPISLRCGARAAPQLRASTNCSASARKPIQPEEIIVISRAMRSRCPRSSTGLPQSTRCACAWLAERCHDVTAGSASTADRSSRAAAPCRPVW